MSKVYYYGRKTRFVGKTLFEILANLRDFGINRMILKQEELIKNPGQKCYYIVKKVEPVMDEKLEQGAIYAEQIHKGARVPGLVFIDEETWHTDWQLVPKHEESLYRVDGEKLIEHGHPDTVKVLPRWMEVPPLMDIFLRRHYEARDNITVAPVKLDAKTLNIMMHYKFDKINKPFDLHRIAEEGEKSDETINRPIKTLLMEEFRPNRDAKLNHVKK